MENHIMKGSEEVTSGQILEPQIRAEQMKLEQARPGPWRPCPTSLEGVEGLSWQVRVGLLGALETSSREASQSLGNFCLQSFFFFHYFPDAFLERSSLDFPSQLASKSPPNAIKNWCQDAFPCCSNLLIDFWTMYTPNFDPRNFENQSHFNGYILRIRLQRFQNKIDSWSHFGANLVPFSLPKSTEIPSKIDPARSQNFERSLLWFFPFWFSFEIQLGATLPTSSPKMDDANRGYPLLCCVRFFLFSRRPGATLAPFWLHSGASKPYLGLILYVLGFILDAKLVLCWALLAQILHFASIFLLRCFFLILAPCWEPTWS